MTIYFVLSAGSKKKNVNKGPDPGSSNSFFAELWYDVSLVLEEQSHGFNPAVLSAYEQPGKKGGISYMVMPYSLPPCRV